MSLFVGPLFVDQVGANTGAALNAADLNCFALAQTFWMNPVTPTFATFLLTWSSAPQIVVNSGAGGSSGYVQMASNTFTITASGSGSQDYYVFALNSGSSYSTINVTAGTPLSVGSYPTNGCLVAVATSNVGNTAITSVSIALCPTLPFPVLGMTTNGSNAVSPVVFPGSTTLTVPGLLTASAGATISGGNTSIGSHLVTSGPSPTYSTSGTSIAFSSAVLTGNDIAGRVDLTSSSLVTLSAGSAYAIGAIVFAAAFGAAPKVLLTNINPTVYFSTAAGILHIALSTTTQCAINYVPAISTSFSSTSSLSFYYHIIG